jgi:hypothetical protein
MHRSPPMHAALIYYHYYPSMHATLLMACNSCTDLSMHPSPPMHAAMIHSNLLMHATLSFTQLIQCTHLDTFPPFNARNSFDGMQPWHRSMHALLLFQCTQHWYILTLLCTHLFHCTQLIQCTQPWWMQPWHRSKYAPLASNARCSDTFSLFIARKCYTTCNSFITRNSFNACNLDTFPPFMHATLLMGCNLDIAQSMHPMPPMHAALIHIH